MTDFYERRALGTTGQVEDLRDGTSIRGLSPRRGNSDSGFLGIEHTPRAAAEYLLLRINQAVNSAELQKIAVSLVGPQCFAAGVIVGIGADVVNSVLDLAKLVGKFVLADLYDLATHKVHWIRFADPTIAPRMLVGKLADAFYGDTLRQAAEERNALIKEISQAFDDPKGFFEGAADKVIEGYQKEWQEFKAHMQANSLEGRFKAGMIFGKLLMVVIGLATGIYGAAKLGAKAVTELPKLVALAKKVKLKAGDIKAPHATVTKSSSGGSSGVAQTPGQVRSEVTQGTTWNDSIQSQQSSVPFGILRSPKEYMGVEPASNELLTAVGKKRSLVIAKPNSEELRMLDYFGAEASVGGVNNSSILLRQNPSKAAVLEEFLHGTQTRLGVVDRLGTSGLGSAETHVKDFMIRHQQMLGLSAEDVRILQVLRDKGL